MKGPLPPDEWDHLTPSLTPGQGAAMEATAGGVETTHIAAEETGDVEEAGSRYYPLPPSLVQADEEDAAEAGGQYSPSSPSYVAAEEVENPVGFADPVEKQWLDADAAVDAFYKADVD